ncbi:MAG TPA: MlaD family protein [Solirubrobacteraceae bacterium]|nr:MlaD family protein [Solirubrobacteraceae bacterium]
MAATSPPSSPASPPPSPESGAPRVRTRRGPGPIVAVLALAVVVLIIAFLAFGGSGGGTYHLEMKEADQLVRGDQVQVGGVPVGSITNITLTHDFKALVTIHVDSSLTPLHKGTLAQVRVPSLSSVANRYIALEPGPNNNPALSSGETLPASSSGEVTDLDQLFNTLNGKTRKGLQNFIQGNAEQYAGSGKELGESSEYFAPALGSVDHFFSELVRDQPTLTNFLLETSKAVTTIGARKEKLADLIENLNTTFTGIGSKQTELAQGLRQLPATLNQGNHTFAELPATFAVLEKFVTTSRPTTKSLTTLLAHLRPLLSTATPAVHNFNLAVNQPGPSNDLTDLVRELPALAKTLSTASPSTVTSLKESVPITSFFGPYAPDLVGTLRTFGQATSYYDANGHYVRLTPVFPDFALGSNNTLHPATEAQAVEGLKTGQLRRCPGAATAPAADGSSPFVDGELLSCDPSETP